MLVAALAGLDRIKAAYAHAAAAGYRFFSYGDACLIEARPDAANMSGLAFEISGARRGGADAGAS